MTLPDDFLPRATQLLLPRLATADEREAWLAQAFFLNDPRLYHDLRQMSGAPIVYVTRCITALLTAKCIPGRDVHSLALLLNAVRIGSAPSEMREIDVLVTMLDPMCGPDAAPDPATTKVNDTATMPVVKPVTPLQTIDTPVDERTPTVFISYAHRDDEFAGKLIGDLQNAGHAIWIDTVSIKGGDAWVRSIADGIRNSYAFLTIVSPDANGSRWVLREYLLAENLKKPIYPILARQSEIPFQMIDRQVVLMTENYATGLRELLETLPAPSIPLPPIEDIIVARPGSLPVGFDTPTVKSAPARAPAMPAPQPAKATTPAGPDQAAQQEIPPVQTAPATRSSGGLNLPDVGGWFGGLKDVLTRRKREGAPPPPPADDERKADEEKARKPEAPRREQASESAPEPAASTEAEEQDYLDAELAAELAETEPVVVVPATNRRALELQYVQRQWAEAFSAQQDAPESNDDMIVRWMALTPDADLDADATGAESGHVDSVGAGLMAMRRAVVMGDSPREVFESIWSALNALYQDALNDPTKPLPVIINLSKWSDAEQSLEEFVHGQLGELGDYWQGLLENKRAALLFTGFEDLPDALRDARKDAVEVFLNKHPELLVLIAMVG